jgi:hypothetical protein
MLKTSFIPSLFLAIFLLLTACEEEQPAYDKAALLGNWACTELYQNDEPQSFMAGTIKFKFENDSVYHYQGGLHKESGKWWLKGKLLVTQADGELEKSVRIEELDSLHLLLIMNDRGIDTKMKLEPMNADGD